MNAHTYLVPPARAAVADPQLTRPDWTRSAARDPRLLWLDKNENTDPELALLTARLIGEVAPAFGPTYPECPPFYNKLADYLDVASGNLLLTAGSDGAIRTVFEAFINPGDVVIHTAPTFAMYSVYCRMYGAVTIALAYEPSDKGPSLPVKNVVKAIADASPKLVCLPNPDSPTGTVFNPDELRHIIEVAGDVGSLILIDEAYHPFYEYTALPWINEYPHLVIARTFAKAWGLAGLRIGYAAACHDLTRVLHKVRPMYEVNTLSVAVMDRMIDYSEEMMASVRRLNEGRDVFSQAMTELNLRTLPANGNFLHVQFGARAEAVHAALSDLVLYRQDSNDACLKGFSRFSATTTTLFQPIIDKIRQVFAGELPEKL
jgi:histidinol-phosphate aminotransferase